ncbi:Uncharacterised protein [Bordetella pertussis]|nr:Uncharacterised protein [Bordetella pertussis]
MGAGPHVGERQRPEVHDGQTVRINRTAGLLGHEVIHHAEEAGVRKKPTALWPYHHCTMASCTPA